MSFKDKMEKLKNKASAHAKSLTAKKKDKDGKDTPDGAATPNAGEESDPEISSEEDQKSGRQEKKDAKEKKDTPATPQPQARGTTDPLGAPNDPKDKNKPGEKEVWKYEGETNAEGEARLLFPSSPPPFPSLPPLPSSLLRPLLFISLTFLIPTQIHSSPTSCPLRRPAFSPRSSPPFQPSFVLHRPPFLLSSSIFTSFIFQKTIPISFCPPLSGQNQGISPAAPLQSPSIPSSSPSPPLPSPSSPPHPSIVPRHWSVI